MNERIFAEVEHLVEAEPVGELILKGAKPMSAFRVLDLNVDAGRPEALLASEADGPAKDLG